LRSGYYNIIISPVILNKLHLNNEYNFLYHVKIINEIIGRVGNISCF